MGSNLTDEQLAEWERLATKLIRSPWIPNSDTADAPNQSTTCSENVTAAIPSLTATTTATTTATRSATPPPFPTNTHTKTPLNTPDIHDVKAIN